MDNVQKVKNCINTPSAQTLHLTDDFQHISTSDQSVQVSLRYTNHPLNLWDPHLSPAGAPLSTLSAESTASADMSTRPTSSSAVFTADGVQCCVCRGGGVGFTGRAGFGGKAGLPTHCRFSCNPSGVLTGVEVLCGGDNSPLSSRRIPYSNM
jgi:hypothetical protein